MSRVNITYDSLILPDTELNNIRRSIYHSDGPGYFIFRKFISPDFVAHITKFWTEIGTMEGFKTFHGKGSIRYGCPNFYKRRQGNNECFYNFFWNTPRDSATYSVAFTATMLRNRIEGYEAYREFFPLVGHPTFSRIPHSVSFRVVISRSGSVVVPSHADSEFYGALEPWRTQMTLFLSKRRLDYSGDGFYFESNQGKSLLFDRDIDIAPGDLVIWKYANLHSVKNISAEDNSIGFMRILFPPERVYPDNLLVGALERFMESNRVDRIVSEFKSTQIARKLVRPLYSKFRGR